MVSRRLGHNRASITLDVNRHLIPTKQEELANMIEVLVMPTAVQIEQKLKQNHGWAFLSTIKDLYYNFIVAREFGKENSIALVQNNLYKAKQKEKVTDGLLLHSDQGYQ